MTVATRPRTTSTSREPAKSRAAEPTGTAVQPVGVPFALGLLGVCLSGAVFGLFYAWVCTTMWGLDAGDPRVAIEAMQSMNGSVRNATFAPAFFGTPFVLFAATWSARRHDRVVSSRCFLAGGLVYLFGGLLLTMVVNVPMNEELATVVVPENREMAALVWNDYSGRWQFWNSARTVFSGVSLVWAAIGLARLSTATVDRQD